MPDNPVLEQCLLNLCTGQLWIVDTALDLQAVFFDFAGTPTPLACSFQHLIDDQRQLMPEIVLVGFNAVGVGQIKI